MSKSNYKEQLMRRIKKDFLERMPAIVAMTLMFMCTLVQELTSVARNQHSLNLLKANPVVLD